MARWAAVCASAVACMYLPTVHAFLGVPSLVVRRGTADWRALETPRSMHGPGAAMPRRTRCAAAALCMQLASALFAALGPILIATRPFSLLLFPMAHTFLLALLVLCFAPPALFVVSGLHPVACADLVERPCPGAEWHRA